jgi:hypothetical protein
MQPAMERFNGSAGDSFFSPGLRFEIDIVCAPLLFGQGDVYQLSATFTELSGNSLPNERW